MRRTHQTQRWLPIVALCLSSSIASSEGACFAYDQPSKSNLPQPSKSPLVLETGINGLRQQFVVVEGHEFWIATTFGEKRWVISGSVGKIVDGIVPVELGLQAGVAVNDNMNPSSSHLKLRVNEYRDGFYGTIGVSLRHPWIRRGLDPVPVLTEAIMQRDAGFYTAVSYLGELGSAAKAAVPALIDLLKSENEGPPGEPYNTLYKWTAETLGKIGPDAKSAVPELLKLLKDSNGHVRVAAALSLWKIAKHPAAVPALIEALRDRNKFIRFEAVAALRDIGVEAPTAAPALREVLNDEVPPLRIRAAIALWQVARDQNAIESLLEALQHEDETVRASAAGALGEIGPAARRAIPALVRAVADDERPVQYRSAEALRQIDPGATFTLPEIAKTIKSRDSIKLGIAVRHFDRCAIPTLTTALKDENQKVRRMAMGGLYYFGAAGVDSLVPLLSDEDEDTREMAALTLRDIGPEAKAATRFLVEALHDKEGGVRLAAYSALVEIGAPAVPAVAGVLDDESAEVRRLAAAVLGEIGPAADAAAPKLRKLLDDPNQGVREAARMALKRFQSEE